MDWIQSIGLGDLATEFLQKLSAAVNLLATPKETLLQVRECLVLLSSPLLSSTVGSADAEGLDQHVKNLNVGSAFFHVVTLYYTLLVIVMNVVIT